MEEIHGNTQDAGVYVMQNGRTTTTIPEVFNHYTYRHGMHPIQGVTARSSTATSDAS